MAEQIALECGCIYNATHKAGDRRFKCTHGEWIIRHKTRTVHYYNVTYISTGASLFDG